MFAKYISFVLPVFYICISTTTALPIGNHTTSVFQARDNVGDGTYFTPGLGACGINNVDADLIVAVSEVMFTTWPGATANPNLNPICNKALTATYEGKSANFTVTDRCGGCTGLYDLDFTLPGLSLLVADPVAVGRVHGVTWNWI